MNSDGPSRHDLAIDHTWYVHPEGAPIRICAGGVVTRIDPLAGRVLIAFAYHHDHPVGVLPKGHVDPGEALEQAARREIEEEVGFSDLRLLGELGRRDRLDFARTEWKEIHYFLYSTRQVDGAPLHDDVHPPPTWHDLDHMPPLFWPEQQELLESNRDRIRELTLQAVGGVGGHPP